MGRRWAEEKTTPAVGSRKEQEQHDDNRERLEKQGHGQLRRAPVAGDAMKADEGGREQNDHHRHVEPEQEILGEKQRAEREEKSDEREHMEVPRAVGFQQLERDKN